MKGGQAAAVACLDAWLAGWLDTLVVWDEPVVIFAGRGLRGELGSRFCVSRPPAAGRPQTTE